ncbi:MAG: hypothetical protein H7210_14640 [Pyrinomonadaceae bacterium]|nr:hypothetical protein [Phycisphaerales bacterium]
MPTRCDEPPTIVLPPDGVDFIRRSAMSVHQAVFGWVTPELGWDYYVTNIDKSGPFVYYTGKNFAGQTFSFDTATTHLHTTVPGADGHDVRATMAVGMLTGPAGEAACYVAALEGTNQSGLIVLGTFSDQAVGRQICEAMWERGGRTAPVCVYADQLYAICESNARADFFACVDNLESIHRNRLIGCGIGTGLSCLGCGIGVLVPIPGIAPIACTLCGAALTCLGATIVTFNQNMEIAITERNRVQTCCCNAASARFHDVPPGQTVGLCTYKCP